MNPSGTFTNLITNRTGQGGWNSWKALSSTDAYAAERVHMYQTRPAEELYDLNADPYELNNLASSEEFSEIKSDFATALDEWMRDSRRYRHHAVDQAAKTFCVFIMMIKVCFCRLPSGCSSGDRDANSVLGDATLA